MTQEQLVEQIVQAILQAQAGPVGAGFHPRPDEKSRPDEKPRPDEKSIAAGGDGTPPLQTHPDTSARIAVGRAGTRLRTGTYLQFRADHATARDAVYNDVPAELLQHLGLPEFTTQAASRDEFLTRPDLGRVFSEESRRAIAAHNPKPCDVLVYAADGLSSRAIATNLENILPVIAEGVSQQGLSCGKPFFVKFGRVASMEAIAELTGAKVVCVLIGERPGLGSADSMSAYMAYEPVMGMPEARRTVVSNIYHGGLNAVEAGAYIAELLVKMHKSQKSGVELNAE